MQLSICLQCVSGIFTYGMSLELRETYTKHRRSYTKQTRPTANSPASTPISPSPPPINLVASRLQIEKEYKVAMQKQDNKIDLAMRMYDLISRHIERLDSQITKSGVSGVDWIGTKKETLSDEKLFMDQGMFSRKVCENDIQAMEADIRAHSCDSQETTWACT